MCVQLKYSTILDNCIKVLVSFYIGCQTTCQKGFVPIPRKTRGTKRTSDSPYTDGLVIKRRTRVEWSNELTKALLRFLAKKGYYASWPQPDYGNNLWSDAEASILAETGTKREGKFPYI